MKIIDKIKKATLREILQDKLTSEESSGGDSMSDSFEIAARLAPKSDIEKYQMVAESPELLTNDWNTRGTGHTMTEKMVSVAVADWMATLTSWLDEEGSI